MSQACVILAYCIPLKSHFLANGATSGGVGGSLLTSGPPRMNLVGVRPVAGTL
jgi:hypothetical protein